MLAGEIDLSSCELTCLILRGDVAELDESRLVVLESVFVHEERHEYAVNVKDEIFGVCTVEDVVIKVERHLAVHTVRLADASDAIDCFFTYHQSFSLLICAPRALRRASMSS